MTSPSLPSTQYAVQLVGPGKLALNTAKPVDRPGPTQILARIECVGLCFSDLKLLKQFDQHARKSEILAGLAADVLREIPSYVPGDKPTVPGHEVSCAHRRRGRQGHAPQGRRAGAGADRLPQPCAPPAPTPPSATTSRAACRSTCSWTSASSSTRPASGSSSPRRLTAPRAPSPWSSPGPASRTPTSTSSARVPSPAGGSSWSRMRARRWGAWPRWPRPSRQASPPSAPARPRKRPSRRLASPPPRPRTPPPCPTRASTTSSTSGRRRR